MGCARSPHNRRRWLDFDAEQRVGDDAGERRLNWIPGFRVDERRIERWQQYRDRDEARRRRNAERLAEVYVADVSAAPFDARLVAREDAAAANLRKTEGIDRRTEPSDALDLECPQVDDPRQDVFTLADVLRTDHLVDLERRHRRRDAYRGRIGVVLRENETRLAVCALPGDPELAVRIAWHVLGAAWDDFGDWLHGDSVCARTHVEPVRKNATRSRSSRPHR